MSLDGTNTGKRKALWPFAAGLLLAIPIGWLCLYVLTGVQDAIIFNSTTLLNLRKAWLYDGSPQPVPVEKYVAKATDPERFFVWTNTYTIDGQTFQSLLGMKDLRFGGKGILVVSKDGRIIWVDSDATKSPKLIKSKR